MTTSLTLSSRLSTLKTALSLLIIICFAIADMKAQTPVSLTPSGASLIPRGDESYNLFPNSFSDAKVQLPIYSNILADAGVTSGSEIVGIQWEVVTDNTPSTSTWNLSISDSYTGPVVPFGENIPFLNGPFTTVATDAPDAGQYTGTHTMMFDTPYIWDGNSNLVLQACRTSAAQFATDQTLVYFGSNAGLVTHYFADCSETTAIYGSSGATSVTLLVNYNCATPSNINHALLAPARCFIVWDDVEGAQRYDVHYRVQGTTDWTRVSSINSQRSLYALQPDTWYEYFVRSSCDGTWDFSAKSEIRRFNTANIPSSATRMAGFQEEEMTGTAINSIYPNPAKDVLNIEFDNPSEADVLFSIMDISGKMVHQDQIYSREGIQIESIDISALNHGYYILVMESDGDKTYEKFIVAE